MADLYLFVRFFFLHFTRWIRWVIIIAWIYTCSLLDV